MAKTVLFLLCSVIVSCSQSTQPPLPTPTDSENDDKHTSNTEERTFLALGDSYTIGERVDESDRWPVQLTDQLNEVEGLTIQRPTIIAKTGWTTDELLRAVDNTELDDQYDLVTLLIGVNNQYRGYNIEQFTEEFKTLLTFAIKKAGQSNRVIVVSIPDWGVMPFAEGRDREQIAQEIDEYNQIKEKITTQMNAHFVDITNISRQANSQPEYIAEDGLHPSGAQYRAWVEKIRPIAKAILQ